MVLHRSQRWVGGEPEVGRWWCCIASEGKMHSVSVWRISQGGFVCLCRGEQEVGRFTDKVVIHAGETLCRGDLAKCTVHILCLYGDTVRLSVRLSPSPFLPVRYVIHIQGGVSTPAADSSLSPLCRASKSCKFARSRCLGRELTT